jgi:hypothetical protein
VQLSPSQLKDRRHLLGRLLDPPAQALADTGRLVLFSLFIWWFDMVYACLCVQNSQCSENSKIQMVASCGFVMFHVAS